jgi:hypothetical protein
LEFKVIAAFNERPVGTSGQLSSPIRLPDINSEAKATG